MSELIPLSALWHPDEIAQQPDSHVAFRGTFELAATGEIEVRVVGASWYVVWLGGEIIGEGPPRYAPEFPEYQTLRANLAAGTHVLAVQVHYLGVSMRVFPEILPFLWCEVHGQNAEIEVHWKTRHLTAYASARQRISAQLGWVEWCDTRDLALWQTPEFDDADWQSPQNVTRELGALKPSALPEVRQIPHKSSAVAGGELVEMFGYEPDNPAARFFLRDLHPTDLPAQGAWRRYDLGRVRLGRPKFTLDLPSGAVVECALSEQLRHERVSPWITLSASDSCNLDHWVARSGVQEFSPLTPKGGRFLEVHVLAPPDEVKWLDETFVERVFYGEAQGEFGCDDELLNKIWRVGVETHRACSEDALTDNPTRERGQWAGDVVTVGLEIAGAAFGDLGMCRRGLVGAAQSARPQGLVAGLYPGTNRYLSTFAAQWLCACVHFWELTGDIQLLHELFPFAVNNLADFEIHLTPAGLDKALGWGFMDWGYVPNVGASDMGVNLHYLAALRQMQRWCAATSHATEHYARLDEKVSAILADYYANAPDGDAIGYHRVALGLRLGFFEGARESEAVAFLKSHITRCFPNDASAPRLSDPRANNPRLITPYFAHFALPELIERGEMDFVLAQYRHCWGWALGDNRTTWLEVFDTRWSHCHQWSGCPTWQLSRYVLGLWPRADWGNGHFELAPIFGSLQRAAGRVPIAGTADAIEISWTREGEVLDYQIKTPMPLTLHLQSGETRAIEAEERFSITP